MLQEHEEKVLKQAKGYFGRRKNVWTVAKNAETRPCFTPTVTEKPKNATSVHCGLHVSTLQHDYEQVIQPIHGENSCEQYRIEPFWPT